MFHVGLIGLGRIGKLHAENLVKEFPQANLAVVADPFLNDDMRAWAQSLGIKNLTAHPDEVFRHPQVEAVLICSPTPTHEALIIEAAQAGKHVFCEKPIGSDIAQIERALEEVEKRGVKLQVGFVRRFDHNHRKVRESVKEGKIGKPYLVKITSRDPQPPSLEYLKASGGIFFDMTIHDFDMARYLSGSEVEEVFACGTVLVDEAVAGLHDFDTAVVTLRFTNGMIGIIDNCRQAVYGYDQRTEVHGSQGCIWVENDRPNTSLLLTRNGTVREPFLWFFLERYKQAFIDELKAFFHALGENTQPPVDGVDGLKAVLIAQAASRSAREGRIVKVGER